MKNSLLPLFVAVFTMACFAQTDTMTLDHRDVFKKKQRSPVLFTHANHMMVDSLGCKACHHRYEKGRNVLDEGELEAGAPAAKCEACHSHKRPASLQKAFHRQCMECHRGLVKQKKKSGPLTCAECHPRAK
ncbi:MAG: cytochrome c3 family protein [Fibrobacterota bacterium]